MKLAPIKINIKGSEWTIQILADSTYRKRFGRDSMALTDLDTKRIFFNKNLISPGVIRHELLHAIVAEVHLESASITPDQIEEICASIVETQWNNMNSWAELILNSLLKEQVNAATSQS